MVQRGPGGGQAESHWWSREVPVVAKAGLSGWRFARSVESLSLRLWLRVGEEMAFHPEMT